MPDHLAGRRSALLLAAAATLAVLCWQAATVHFSYGGNWTALFCTGDRWVVPPELAPGTYVFPRSPGFDGQFYRYVAHDPWFAKSWIQYHDRPTLRYGRILVPALAWATAFGNPRFIDGAYIAWILISVFCGVWWLGRWAALHGRHPAWGLAFLAMPATLISIDRLTVDVALVAICAGVLLYHEEERPGRVYALLIAAPLVRDTGFLLIAACIAHALIARRFRRAVLYATAAIPVLLWYHFASSHLIVPMTRARHWLPGWFFHRPLAGIVMKLFLPERYPFAPLVTRAVQVLDAAASCGMLLAFGAAVWSLRRGPRALEQWILLAFAILMVAVSATGYWSNVYNYARPLTPLLLFTTTCAIATGPRWLWLSLVLIDLRIAAQCAPQGFAIVRGLL